MKRSGWLSVIVVAAFLVPLGVMAMAAPPTIPATPAAVDGLVYAQPFTLDEGYQFDWRRERPVVTSGYLLVLKVNPALVYPRQVAEPVLYVGDQTAERVNVGYRSGYVVAIVPGEVDLTETPIWFGTPELPERADANNIASERSLAESAKIKPFGADTVNLALALGGQRMQARNRAQLLQHVATLITTYSPVEQSLAEGLAPASK